MPDYTEQQIRGLAINFLRFHYKLRPRYAGGGTRIVDRPHYYQGVLIDARLAYQRPDRTFFTATIEATSVDKREEIVYLVNYWRVVIHAFVLTLTLGALTLWGLTLLPAYSLPELATGVSDESILAGSQVRGFNLWRAFGRPRVYGVILSYLVVSWGTLGILLSRWRVYRYIYAVDQFKRFYADAQWVAFDAEIFAADTRRTRRRYRELERQCIRWGFGLLRIGREREVRIIVSPSQVDQFGGDRLQLPKWISNVEKQPLPLVRVLRGGRRKPPAPALPPPAEATDPLAVGPYLDLPVRREDALPPMLPIPGRPRFYARPDRQWKRLRARLRRSYRRLYPGRLRRRPGYYELGGWVFALGFSAAVALGVGLYIQARYEPVARPGERAAAPDLDGLESTTNPAPFNEIEEGEYRPTVDNRSADPETVTGVPADALIDDGSLEEGVGEDLYRYRLTATGARFLDYACVPLSRLGTTTYVLLLGRFPGFGAARLRAEQINRRYAVPVAAARSSCIDANDSGYLVYLEAPTDDEGAVNFWARKYGRDLGLELEVLVIN